MILNTDKGGTYRYCSCSRSMKQGKTACPGRRIRMDLLDGMVLGNLSKGLFNPERLSLLLKSRIGRVNNGRAKVKERFHLARDARWRVGAAIARLVVLVEKGIMEPDAPELRERLVALRLQRAELDRDVSCLQNNLQAGKANLSPEALQSLSIAMHQRLTEGPPVLRQAYVRLVLGEVTIDYNGVRLEGLPRILRNHENYRPSQSTTEVPSLVQE